MDPLHSRDPYGNIIFELVDVVRQTVKVKVKVPLDNFIQSCLTLGGGAHARFQAIEPAFCPKTIFRGHMASAT